MTKFSLALLIIIVSSFLFSFSVSAQNDLGINPEHMPDLRNNSKDLHDSAINDCFKIRTDISAKNGPEENNKQAVIKSPGNVIPTLIAYEHDGDLHYTVYYRNEKESWGETSATIKTGDDDFTSSIATEFLLAILVTKPAAWYLTRMNVVRK